MPERDLLTLPKAHLHLHFTGSMRVGTVRDLAHRHGHRLPASLLEQWPPALADVDERRGWFRFQRLYDLARACVRSEEDMRRIVDEAAQDDAAEGSVWLEIQVDPTSYAPFVGGITPALEIVLDEARAATARHGIGVAVVVAASRIRHPLEARTLARLAARYAGEGAGSVVGFGLSNDERRGDTGDFAAAFRIAQRAGLGLMPHAGELLGPDAVADTLDLLRPHRLGHGVRSAESDEVLARVVDQGITLEVCPGSNVALGVYDEASEVPLRRLMSAGARIALGADDPLLFGTRLVDQYRFARTVHGLADSQLAELARASIEGSRAPLDVRRRAEDQLSAWATTSAIQSSSS